MHDIVEPADPPVRQEIAIYDATDRAGSPICQVDPKTIAGFILTDNPNESTPFAPATETTERIGANVAEFLVRESLLRRGRAQW